MHLEIKSVSKSFTDKCGKTTRVVNDFSLSVKTGEFVCLVGPSGCGKTTILRIVAGLTSPDSGKIFIEGKDITRLPPEKRQMAVVFQHYALFPHMNVFGNVAFGLSVRKFPKNEIRSRVRSILELVGLGGFETRSPGELSGGQQQRVALARALAIDPSVLLCDEPLSNLDASLRAQMRTEIKSIQKKLNATVLYVTHDEEDAKALADRIIVMTTYY